MRSFLIISALVFALIIFTLFLFRNQISSQLLGTRVSPPSQENSQEHYENQLACGHDNLGTLTYDHDTGVISCSVMGGTHNIVYDKNKDGIWDEGDYPPNLSAHGWPPPLTPEQLEAVLKSSPTPSLPPDASPGL